MPLQKWDRLLATEKSWDPSMPVLPKWHRVILVRRYRVVPASGGVVPGLQCSCLIKCCKGPETVPDPDGVYPHSGRHVLRRGVGARGRDHDHGAHDEDDDD